VDGAEVILYSEFVLIKVIHVYIEGFLKVLFKMEDSLA
jgi:hypothetical protein